VVFLRVRCVCLELRGVILSLRGVLWVFYLSRSRWLMAATMELYSIYLKRNCWCFLWERSYLCLRIGTVMCMQLLCKGEEMWMS
jgi:hypothetical protein